RVTEPMVRVHAQDFSNVQQKKLQNKSYVPAVEDYQGTAVYLMGMTYYQKESSSFDLIENLNKITIFSRAASGISAFRSKTVGGAAKTQPRVDMSHHLLVEAGFNCLHADGDQHIHKAANDYGWLEAAEGSA